MTFNFQEGEYLLINKPYEWTSFDVVKKLKYSLRIKKIGHAGTLDPLATGLLILCTGKMTKQIDSYQAQEKEYTGELVLGATTPSVDLETEINATFDISHITEELLFEKVKQFTGDIEQVPPMFSAIKINGERVYKKARKGEEVIIKARKITVSVFEFTKINFPKVEFRIVCSKGTYIRSLVRDLGQALDSGAYMSALTRTRIGEFKLEDAYDVNDFIQLVKNSPEESE